VNALKILAVVLLASSALFGAWAVWMFVAAADVQGDPDARGALFLLVCLVLCLVGVSLLRRSRHSTRSR
jgi:O-antigen ligase